MKKIILSLSILLTLFSNSSLASKFLTDFRIKINEYSLLYTAPAEPHIARGKVMFPLLGLIYVTRGFEWFETYTVAPPSDIRKREFVAPTDFDRFVQVDATKSTVTIRLVNAVGQPRFKFVAGSDEVEIRASGGVAKQALSTRIRILDNDPRKMFVALSDLATLFGFVAHWDASTRTAQISNPRWMRIIKENSLTRLSFVELVEGMFPTRFIFKRDAGSVTVQVTMKSRGENLDLSSAGVYVYGEAYTAFPSYAAISMYNLRFERPIGGRDPPNPFPPNPCQISLARLDCTYTVPLEPDQSLKYLLAISIR